MNLTNDNIIHVKGKNADYIQFRKLLEYPEIVHCYTLSAHKFDISGNDTIADNKENVLENYKKISEELGINYNNIIRPYQTHTDVVENVEYPINRISIFPRELTDVDGLLTSKTNVVFSLGYADCTPLFLYDPVKKVIGDIHSGWKGTLQKIGQKAVRKMIDDYKCNPKDIICCIGPTIRKCHFEVDEDVKDLFYKEFSYTNRIDDIIQKGNVIDNKQKYNVDTVLINKVILQEIGLRLENIIDSKICTACNSDIMHSYRVNGKSAGRNTAIIGMKEE